MLSRRALLASVSAAVAGLAAARVVRAGDIADPHPRAMATLSDARRLWADDAEREDSLDALRRINPEWDFMSRTFLVQALAEQALSEPASLASALDLIDQILADTLHQERQRGQDVFLMSYVHHRAFVGSGRSVFVDGEIGMMLATRELLEPGRWRSELDHRVAILRQELQAGPIGSAESYPDECWTFCNTFALATLRVHTALGGPSHQDLIQRWLDNARAHLIDPVTGMLVSSYTWGGQPADGPEGSSIFLSATNLLLVDPDFAREQYRAARAELGDAFFGMGYAREWPDSWEGHLDVDSGPLVPLLDASPSSSGFALMAARAFDDRAWYRRLVRALNAADAVMTVHPTLKQMADNVVGDIVVARALTFGPTWSLLGA